jgi:uncharacterized protein (TIGR00369 family)
MIDHKTMTDFFAKEFPQANFELEHLGEMSASIRKKITHHHLRPGGTVAGPVMMEIADTVLYVAILNQMGLVALAVTTSLNINFLRKPVADRDIIAECKLIKLGKTLAVGEVSIYSDGMPEPVAQAVGTYSIPPAKTN